VIRIYLACPYSAPTAEERLENTRHAMTVGLELLHRGYQPFVALLSHFWDEHAAAVDLPVTYARWLEWDLCWLAQCDAILVLGMSPGVETEIEFALKNKIPVYYSVQELPPPQ
jgi:hypothetical protein